MVKHLYIFLILLFVIGCSNNKDTNPKIVAIVGDEKIYADDFLKNYEFGFASLRHGENSTERKLNYLNYLINEKLIALEGYKNNVNSTKEFLLEKKFLERELLLEQFMDFEIKPRIKITQSEIEKAIKKSKVKFKVEYWSETNPNNLTLLKRRFENDGFTNTINSLIKENKELSISKHHFESGFISWLDVSADIFEVIRKLEINEVSEPHLIDGVYYFYTVKDIRRESITEQELLDKSPSFRKILYNRYLQVETVAFVDSLLTPKNITTKKETFLVFYNAIKDWLLDPQLRKGEFQDYLNSSSSSKNKENYLELEDHVIVDCKDQTLTLNQLQEFFYFNRIDVDSTNLYQLKEQLAQLIAISVRDKYLIEYTLEKYGELSDKYNNELGKWQDKWAYHIYRSKLLKVKITTEYLDKLKDKYQVTIYLDVLEAIEVADSEKSKNITVNVFRNGTNRMAEPIVDASWAMNKN